MNNDGGRAFPSVNEVRLGEFGTGGHAGMTLRDYFAAKAMPECCRVASDQTPLSERGPRLSKLFDKAATYAYYYADSMLKAREVKS